MKLSASLQASANVPFELEYAEKRLEHYRQIVSSGKLKAFLETGKERREDYFQVDRDSPLGKYLRYGPNKTRLQAENDKSRMIAYPYNWKVFNRKTSVKCPACGKTQPWCESMDREGAGTKAFFLGCGVFVLCLVPFIAGLTLPKELRLLAYIPTALQVASSVLIYKALRKKQLARLAALPWNADDLPRFDEDFLAAQKAHWQQAKDMGMMP